MLTFKRRIDIIKYCWKDSKKAKDLSKGDKSRWAFFTDMVRFSFKYEKDNRDYMRLAYYDKSSKERDELHVELSEQLRAKRFKDEQLVFHAKWTSQKWEHPRKFNKRTQAYRKRFNMGERTSIRYNVWITSTHNRIGELKIGSHCSFGRNAEVDYTGGLIIGNGVDISERCMILTHGHQFFGNRMDSIIIKGTDAAYPTPLVIEDNVWIGAGAYIMPGVKRIGENSVISAGSIVNKEVPPNCIVAGNPAKVIFEMPEGYRTYYQYKK